ncbi:hypothetical protein PLESTM_000069400 [Pleodorina starrii]|nr:hypothetical protein PLESTM_000069400 [Pleodorina starrii]
MQRRDSHTALGDFMTTAVVSTLRKRTRARSTIAEDEVSEASQLPECGLVLSLALSKARGGAGEWMIGCGSRLVQIELFFEVGDLSSSEDRSAQLLGVARADEGLASRLISRTTMKPSVMLAGPVTIDHNLDTIQLWYVTGFILPQVAVGLMDGLCSAYSDGKVFDSVIKMYLYLNKSPMAELLWPLYPAACQSWPLVMLLPVPKTK